MDNVQLERPKEIHDKRKGLMISSIILFSLSLIFFIGTVIFIFQNMLTGDKNTDILGFVLFLITTGWISYLPALILAIAGVCTSRFGLKSTSKTIKNTCLVFLILSALLLTALILLGIFISFFPYVLK